MHRRSHPPLPPSSHPVSPVGRTRNGPPSYSTHPELRRHPVSSTARTDSFNTDTRQDEDRAQSDGEVLDTLRMLAGEGMTMIAVTHEIPFAREVADRVAFFHEDVIHGIGSAKDIVNSPKKQRTREFLGKIL